MCSPGRHRPLRHWVATVVVLCAATSVCLGQDEEPLALPYPVCMAYGDLQIADLDAYTDAGLNVAYITVAPPLSVEANAALLDFLSACDKHDLPVIVEIAPMPLVEDLRVSPFSEAYASALADYVVATVSALKRQRAICAWAMPSELTTLYTPSDDDLRKTLIARYQSLDAIEQAWGKAVRRWDSITVAEATRFDDARPCGLGPSALDFADCRASAHRELVSLWCESLNRADATRPAILGRESSRAAYAAFPDNCSALIAGSPAELINTWGDALSPLQVARRAGRRDVLLCIPTASAVFRAADKVLTTALIQGAYGFVFEDWELVSNNALLQMALSTASTVAESLGGHAVAPRTHIAVLHQPYADGAVLADGRGLYGFLSGLSPGEPSLLLDSLAVGHRFGTTDVIGTDDLIESRLSQYRVILAPMAFDLDPERLNTLIGWVNAGGILVVDLGAGMHQTGSMLLLPPGLDMLTGVPKLGRVADLPTDFMIVDAPPPLENLPVGATSHGTPPFYAFNGAVGDALFSLDARLVAGAGARRGPDGRLYQCGIILNAFGSGYCLFSTAPLFATWGVDDPVFATLLDDLLSESPLIEAEPAVGGRLFAKDLVLTALDTGAAVLNLADARTTARILLAEVGGGLLENTWRLFTPDTPDRAARAELLVPLEPDALQVLDQAPIEINASGWAQLSHYDPDLIEVLVRSERARVSSGLDGTLTVKPRGKVSGTIRVRDGRYVVARDSEHRITIIEDTGNVLASTVAVADRSGSFELEADNLGVRIVIVPEA